MGYLYRAPQGMGEKTQTYPSWQGPALSKADRAAYDDYCRRCIDLWGATPAPFESWLLTTKGISVPSYAGCAERSFSTLNTR